MKSTYRFIKAAILTSLLTILGIAFFSTFVGAGAGGGRDMGGGEKPVAIDGKIKLADPSYAGTPLSQVNQIVQVSYYDFPKDLQTYIEQTERVCSLMGICSPTPSKLSFFNATVKTNEKHYFLVPKDRETGIQCNRYLPTPNHSVDSHFQFGCTSGPNTYLFIDKWMQASLEEQVFALLNERFWAQNENADQADISKVVHWLQVYERHFIDQTVNGDRTPLTSEELAGYGELYAAANSLSLLEGRYFHSIPLLISGGALMLPECQNRIAIENSFLGIGSMITCGSGRSSLKIRNSTVSLSSIDLGPLRSNPATTQPRSFEIVDSDIYDSTVSGSTLKNTYVESSTISGAEIIQSSITRSTLSWKLDRELCSQYVENNPHEVTYSDISDSEMEGICSSFQILGKQISRTHIAKLKMSGIRQAKVIFEDEVNISDVEMSGLQGLTALTISKGATLKNFNINFIGSYFDLLKGTLFDSYEAVVEKDTEISNGAVDLQTRCHEDGPLNRFYLGKPEGGYKEDLRGLTVRVQPLFWSCSARKDQ